MKIEIELPEDIIKSLKKISADKQTSIEDLILRDIKGLIYYYKEQYQSIGIAL